MQNVTATVVVRPAQILRLRPNLQYSKQFFHPGFIGLTSRSILSICPQFNNQLSNMAAYALVDIHTTPSLPQASPSAPVRRRQRASAAPSFVSAIPIPSVSSQQRPTCSNASSSFRARTNLRAQVVDVVQKVTVQPLRITVTLNSPLGLSLTEARRDGNNRVVVTSVKRDSPASSLVHVGDVVADISGIPAHSLDDVIHCTTTLPPQSPVTLVLERENHKFVSPTTMSHGASRSSVQEKAHSFLGEGVSSTGVYAEQEARLDTLIDNYTSSRKVNQSLAAADHDALMNTAVIIIRKRSMKSAKSTFLIMSIFHQLKRANVPLTLKFYNITMCALIQTGDATSAVKLFQQIEQPNVECFTTLVKAYSALRKPDDAIALLPIMRARRVRPNIHTYNVLISACVRGGKLAKARRLFTDMLVDKVNPDTVSWNTIINWHVQQNKGPQRLGGALEAFTDMKASGVKPNIVTFTTIMKAYAKSGMLNKAEEVFGEIKRAMPSHLDVGVYNTLIHAHSERLDWRRCIELLDEMEGTVFFNDNDDDDDEDTVDESPAFGPDGKVPPHSESFSRRRPWLSGTSQSYRYDGADSNSSMSGMMEGPVVEDVTYCLVIRACANAGQFERARELFDRMMEHGFYPPPGPAVVSLLSGYANAGRLGDCFEVFKSLKTWGVHPDVRMLSTVMHGCLAAGRAELALSVYRKMESDGLKKDVVINTLLVRAHGMLGNLEKMFEIVRTMLKKRGDGVPTIVTFNALIEWCIRHGDLDHALKALEMTLDARKLKVRINRQTFEELVGKVVPEVLERPTTILESNDVILNQAEYLGDWEKLEYLQSVLEKIRRGNAVPNGILYRGLLLLCERCNEWELGYDLVREREKGLYLMARNDLISVRPTEDKFRARGMLTASASRSFGHSVGARRF